MTGRVLRRFAGLTIGLMLASAAHGQGLVKGVEQGARDGNRAAGPVGGVLGGAIGGVVGIVGGVLGVPANPQPQTPPQQPAVASPPVAAPANRPPPQTKAAKAKEVKAAKLAPRPAPAPVAQAVQPLTAEQIVAASDANIARMKTELKLTPEQEKHWGGFNSAMHYLGNNGAARLTLRNERAKRDPPDDIVEQLRNEAQFLTDRSADQRAVADAAEPLFVSLNDQQKAIFVTELVKLSRERGLD